MTTNGDEVKGSSEISLNKEEDEETATEPANPPLFKNLTADDHQTTEVESLCTECGENGITRLLLTRIPHYKEVILMSFNCDSCGNQNNEIQTGGAISEKGVHYNVTVRSIKDLSRQVVKSDFASFTVPEIELEIPPNSQKGAVTTIEGVLRRTITGLAQDQPVRRALYPESADQIDKYIQRVEDILNVNTPFTIELIDISGNSFIENPYAPQSDPDRTVKLFERTDQQNHTLGVCSQGELKEEKDIEEEKIVEEEEDTALTAEKLQNEVLFFPTNCPECNAPSTTNMKVTNIPHFKEVVIMATVCEYCGHKTNEVKSGGGIEPQGTKISLKITDPTDLTRDVLKSETCSISIPELDFEMEGYSLGGKFTTLEGILDSIKCQVDNNPFMGCCVGGGDSRSKDTTERINNFKTKMDELINGRVNFTFVMDDPTGNSYLQNVYAPDKDPEMTIERYERTFEQNENLGLNDMKVEGYEEDNLVSPVNKRTIIPTINEETISDEDVEADTRLLESTKTNSPSSSKNNYSVSKSFSNHDGIEDRQ